jgi:hypothetical protein
MIVPELSASKVAGFIGLHKYQNANELQYELLLKDKDTCARILGLEQQHGRRAFTAIAKDVLRGSAISDLISTGIRDARHTSNVSGVLKAVQDRAGVILDLVHDTFDPEVKARLVDEVRGQVSKRRGLANEDAILNTYEAAREVKVTERNTKTLKKPMGSWTLVGRCDGYVASENRIVDSKDRTRHWPQVPLYDEIQLRCYMTMYDAAESELIERFPDGQTRHTKYLNDPAKWATLQTAVEAGVATLNAIAADEEELKRVVFANTVSVGNGGDTDERRSARLAGTATLTGL